MIWREHTLKPFNFSYPLRVRYSEIDGQKVVFNAHYLTYLDTTITEYFRPILGDNWLEAYSQTFNIVLVKSTLEFKSPARMDDQLLVKCKVTRLGNSSFTAKFVITRKEANTPLLEAENIFVNVDPKTEKPAPIPDLVREKIRQFEGVV